MRNFGPCLCGATDCPSCGPAQGYIVLRRWDNALRRYVYENPEDDAEDDTDDDGEQP